MITLNNLTELFGNVELDADKLLEKYVFNAEEISGVYRIDDHGRNHLVKPSECYRLGKQTLKIELESNDLLFEKIRSSAIMAASNYAHDFLNKEKLNITVHVFIAKENGYSFATHQDPMNLLIYCYDGVKDMLVQDKHVEIGRGYGMFMAKDIPHKALNFKDSIMLSIGYE